MRSILVSVMLLVLVIIIYQRTIGGEDGSLRGLQISGNQVNIKIEGIDP